MNPILTRWPEFSRDAERGFRGLTGFPLLAALGLWVMAAGVRGQAPQAVPYVSECEALCAGLADAIRAAPEMLAMRIEDALVFNEECAPEIVTTAMDVVGAEPALVKEIVDTAVKVAPRQSAKIMAAVRSFSVPTAVVAVVPEEEVRAAVVPIPTVDGFEVEVRRAEAPVMIGNIPLEEVRPAEPPPRALPADVMMELAAGEEVRRAVPNWK